MGSNREKEFRRLASPGGILFHLMGLFTGKQAVKKTFCGLEELFPLGLLGVPSDTFSTVAVPVLICVAAESHLLDST